jgi:hypothetical protein
MKMEHMQGKLSIRLGGEIGQSVEMFIGEDENDIIFTCEPFYGREDANASRLAMCWNTHDELVEALERFLESSRCDNNCPVDDMSCDTRFAEKVLANARGEK